MDGSYLQEHPTLKEEISRTSHGFCTDSEILVRNLTEIIKTLKMLQDLDVSLDILVETGIGKTVNSFRKHAAAGNVAKTLVKEWKKLTSAEKKSGHRGRKQDTEKDEIKSSVSKDIKPSEKPETSVLACGSSNSAATYKKLNKQRACSEKTSQNRDTESQKECDNRECSNTVSKHASEGTSPQAKESNFKDRTSTGNKKVSEKQRSSAANKDLSLLKEKCSKGVSKQKNTKQGKKPNQKLFIKQKAKLSSDEEFEPPTKSFEYYLNYDQITKKRKRKTCSTGERPKKCSEQQEDSSLPHKPSQFSHAKEEEEAVKRCEGDQSETPTKKAKVASLQDLLNTPLPKFLTGLSISSPPYVADFKASLAADVAAPQQVSETVPFTGRRLNNKMQVYSGSKTACLSKMLTLYELCIRELQNNIDLLREVGGVPFEILEPVLTRCTPEQLFRIEECNPTFTEESDHLWKKHCQRDFKNDNLLEYESWREMYLRLFNQREEKLKLLTRSILSSQSEKPKGRQVKMAYMTSAAKPPRNIRRQQEIHGTAEPVTQLHAIAKYKTRIPEGGDRNNTASDLIHTSNNGNSRSSVMSQEGKKPIKKVGPIMRKTLQALKHRAGRR